MEQPRIRVSAYAMITAGDRLLLTRLSESSPIFEPGEWHLPGGGIDPGEQPEDALAREVREETGLDLTSARLVGVRSYAVVRLGVFWHLIGVFYTAEVASGSPEVIEVDGTTDAVAWLPIPDLGGRVKISPAVTDALRML
ncbi:NUDIX hydrolase [Nonomuraea typhae]|uniref:NUDIX hydrolase n=1 Tax=Nonomuraea typhae TaxID=2603600 RepID=A0ABW7YZ78_9ACTN